MKLSLEAFDVKAFSSVKRLFYVFGMNVFFACEAAFDCEGVFDCEETFYVR